MNVNRTGTKKRGTFKCNSDSEITPNQMRNSACKMVRTLIQLMRTLDKMPADYEPPFFRGCKEEEALNPWAKSPLKMEVGNVNSKHFVLALKVLDPCEDDNDGNQSDNASLAADSAQRDDSDFDSELSHSDDDQYIVAPIRKEKKSLMCCFCCSDDTQDPAEDEEQLGRVKDWISAYHLDKIELTDVLSNFPDISVILVSEIMEKLVKDGAVSKTSSDSYNINKQKVFYFFPLLTHNFLHLLILSRVQLSEHSFMIRRCLIWNKF
nr:meiosis-specific protein ASY1 isoform X1 [Ipomoea batatas]